MLSLSLSLSEEDSERVRFLEGGDAERSSVVVDVLEVASAALALWRARFDSPLKEGLAWSLSSSASSSSSSMSSMKPLRAREVKGEEGDVVWSGWFHSG